MTYQDFTSANLNSQDHRTAPRQQQTLLQQLQTLNRSIEALVSAGLPATYYQQQKDQLLARIEAEQAPVESEPEPIPLTCLDCGTAVPDLRFDQVTEPQPSAPCPFCGSHAHKLLDCEALIKQLFGPTQDRPTQATRLAVMGRISIVPTDDNLEYMGFLDGVLAGIYPTYRAAELAVTNYAYCLDHGLIPLYDAAEMARLYWRKHALWRARLRGMSAAQFMRQAVAHVAYVQKIDPRSDLTAERVATTWRQLLAGERPNGPKSARAVA